MLPLSSILAATPPRTKQRARVQCFGKALVPKRKQATATATGGYMAEDQSGKYREFKYQIKCTDGWRKVATRFYGPIGTKTKVWCWCSCPYFKYHCEVALASKGSSSVVQSNGQRPRFTNPEMKPLVCKHVYLLFALAFRADVKREHAEKKRTKDEKTKNKREAMKQAAEKKRNEQKAKESARKEKEQKLKAAREEARVEAREKVVEKKAEQAQRAAATAQTPKTGSKPLAKGPATRSWAGDKKR